MFLCTLEENKDLWIYLNLEPSCNLTQLGLLYLLSSPSFIRNPPPATKNQYRKDRIVPYKFQSQVMKFKGPKIILLFTVSCKNISWVFFLINLDRKRDLFQPYPKRFHEDCLKTCLKDWQRFWLPQLIIVYRAIII